MKNLDVIVAVLLIIAGLNWGLVGLFNFNIVEFLLGQFPVAVRVVYSVIGLAAVYKIVTSRCSTSCCK